MLLKLETSHCRKFSPWKRFNSDYYIDEVIPIQKTYLPSIAWAVYDLTLLLQLLMKTVEDGSDAFKFFDDRLKQGWAKLFTLRVTFEKTLKPRAALIGRAKKRSTRPQMSRSFH